MSSQPNSARAMRAPSRFLAAAFFEAASRLAGPLRPPSFFDLAPSFLNLLEPLAASPPPVCVFVGGE
jgi:hypothetical protein